jgi:uncharacterized protein YdiU (UPF0061 family)
MDAYDPATVFSSIDHMGRYRYSNQPRIAQWNLARLAETLLPLIDADTDRSVELATASINGFADIYESRWLAVMRAKIGLTTEEEGDLELVNALLDAMHANAVDFTLAFRRLGEGDEAMRALFAAPAAHDNWAARWRSRLAQEPENDETRRQAMNAINPAIIPRNHKVEAMIEAAVSDQDFEPFHEMVRVLSTPYVDAAGYADPPPPDQRVYQTFCGT